MLADTTDKPCIGEQYATAVATSDLRVAEHGSLAASIVGAAGMNKHRTGLALRRLMTEWDRAAKPHKPTAATIARLAASLKVVPARDEDGEPNEYAGLVEQYSEGRGYTWRPPLVIAKETAERWYANELTLLLVSLRSLPAIRDTLIGRFGNAELVAEVLLWWLDSRCPACEGRRNRLIAGTGRTGAKPCGKCSGTGVKSATLGWQGAKMLAYMKGCLTAAAQDLGEGTFKHQRSTKNQDARDAEELRISGKPVLKLPPKIPPRRYSQHGKFYDGEYVTRAGDDVQLVTEMDEEGYSAVFVCVVAPANGWCKVGDRELNLCRRYSKVDYDPKKGDD